MLLSISFIGDVDDVVDDVDDVDDDDNFGDVVDISRGVSLGERQTSPFVAYVVNPPTVSNKMILSR